MSKLGKFTVALLFGVALLLLSVHYGRMYVAMVQERDAIQSRLAQATAMVLSIPVFRATHSTTVEDTQSLNNIRRIMTLGSGKPTSRLGVTAGGVSIELEIDKGKKNEFSATIMSDAVLTRRVTQNGTTAGYWWKSDEERLRQLTIEAGFVWPSGADAPLK